MKILVSDALSEDGISILHENGFTVDNLPEIPVDQIGDVIGQYDGWIIRSRSRATAEIIARADKLRVIGRAGVGVDNVDVDTATARGIVVMNTPGGNTTSTAEHTIAMLLSLARRIPGAVASMRCGAWDRKSFNGVELKGKTLAVLGLGRIGQEVITRLRSFGMHILGYDPFVSQERMKQLGVEPATVDECCRRADFLTVHTPLTEETRGLINAQRLSTMKKTALLVNCARGGIVDEAAVAEALKAKQIAGAAFDVYDAEPLPKDHRLRGIENCILTPHIAASTTEAQDNVAIEVALQVVDLLKHGAIRNAVNAPSIEAELLTRMRPFLRLAERLGGFMAQFAAGAVTRLEVRYAGTVREFPLEPMTTAVAMGFINAVTDDPVNYVNARTVLKGRGVELSETRLGEADQFTNLITVEVERESGAVLRVSGTVFGEHRLRIVLVNDKHFDAVPEGTLVVIENRDVPGIIGMVGTLFGQHRINISQMTWGRTGADGTAMTVINVDTSVLRPLLEEIRQQPDILSAKLIELG